MLANLSRVVAEPLRAFSLEAGLLPALVLNDAFLFFSARGHWHYPNSSCFPIRLFPYPFPYGRSRRLAGRYAYCLDLLLSKPRPR
jgi:hypothetical protein